MKYTQCCLAKKQTNSVRVQTAWIPEKFAIKGKYLRLKEDDGWLVTAVYGTIKLEESVVNSRSRDYLKQRKASDI